jgi:peptide chain release factor 2
MFSNPLDPNNCFLASRPAGGTEAQDWASMLERMYLKYCDKKEFSAEVLEQIDGEVAGIKSATLKVTGDYAYGHLRTESGVHRLVRKSPFDSNARRHTSFAACSSIPRSTNRSRSRSIPPTCASTSTAPRAPAASTSTRPNRRAHHALPTNIVVQSQNDRSQHRNRAECMAMLKSRLYELELRKRNASTKLEATQDRHRMGTPDPLATFSTSRASRTFAPRRKGATQTVLDGDLGRFHQRESQAGGLAMRTFIAAALVAFACGAFGQGGSGGAGAGARAQGSAARPR